MAEAVIGAVLAGGRATRLGGRPKGLLEHSPGKTMLQHTVGVLKAAGLTDVVVLVGDAGPDAAQGLSALPDLRQGLGPLGGIEAALCHSQDSGAADGVLFVPCDLPRIAAYHARRLLAAFRRRPRGVCVAWAGNGRGLMEPLCCVVHRNVLPAVRKALDDERLSVRRLWRDLDAFPVAFGNAAAFHNVNTPADLDAWRRHGKATR